MDAFSRSSSNCSIATNEWLFEQPELLTPGEVSMEKIIWRKSQQMQEEQLIWQVQSPLHN